MPSWYYFQVFFSPLVTIPVAPMMTGMMKHFIFHIRRISIFRFLYFNFLSSSFVLHTYPMVLLRLFSSSSSSSSSSNIDLTEISRLYDWEMDGTGSE
jgi:hypothetical protein